MGSTPKEVKREVRWSYHLKRNEYREDTHLVKELITYDDGSTKPSLTVSVDVRRPVFVTAEPYRRHKDKREFEDRDKLVSQLTTESDKTRTAARMLDMSYVGDNAMAVTKSPYLYGYDITSTSLLKMASLKRNDYKQSPYSVSGFDIETDMWDESVLMATYVFSDVVHTAIVRDFVKGYADPERNIRLAIEKYLPEYKDSKFVITFHDDEIRLLEYIFKLINKQAPDFLAIWNMDFDIPRILDRINRRGLDPKDIICDQSLPKSLRQCWYKEGRKKAVTASGKVKPINPSLQWHALHSSTTFMVIDAMCAYRQLRMGQAERPSYALDAILQHELKKRKLNFSAADHLEKGAWHEFMQKEHPIEYIVYNMYDSLAMLELEAKNQDLSLSLPEFAGITDFWKYSSSVAKVTNSSFLYGLTKDAIIGTVEKTPFKNPGDEDEEDEIILDDDDDDEGELNPDNYRTLGLRGWIQLLPQNQLMPEGLRILEDFPHVRTNIRGATSDADSTSSYPSCTIVGNVSRKTCYNEIIDIEGIDPDIFKIQNLSLNLGSANILEYFTVMFGMPRTDRLDNEIDLILKEIENGKEN